MAAKKKKAVAKKSHIAKVWNDSSWAVEFGELKRGRGRPNATERLFKAVGEKIPIEALSRVKSRLKTQDLGLVGVYMAHDSMGAVRYVGRGNIFTRLRSHFKAHPHELAYFSFFLVEDKQHEREIETLLIRGAGPMLEFNERKKRVGIAPGNVRDFEAGTYYVERQNRRGRKRRS